MGLKIIKKKNYSEERQWEILFEQIVKGNVIPIIGSEFVRIESKTSVQELLDSIADHCDIEEGKFTSFSQLIHDDNYKSKIKGENSIYPFISDIIRENSEFFEQEESNPLLYRLLQIPYFPFVITTVFDPIVENMMRKIHGNKLRIMVFRNDASHNDDLTNGEDAKRPTLYYMFGKAENKEKSYVVTDEDLLQFSQSWLRPNDSGNKVKPFVLSNLLSNKYLLVLGCDYQDWLFRFFWYAMKNEHFGTENSGMLALKKEDQELIGFLTRAKTFSRIEPDMEKFVNKLLVGIEEYERKYGSRQMLPPVEGTDVFLSYSRGDSEITEIIYKTLKAKGLNVWFDRESLPMGQDFMLQIENAVKKSTFFVPILTQTILEQAAEEHPYRKEWRMAVDHIQNIGGIPYCFPFLQKGFNVDDIKAAIPQDLKRHNAFIFTRDTLISDIEVMADYLLNELEKRCR